MKINVLTFNKGTVEVDFAENDTKNLFTGKVLFDTCPTCGKAAEMDLVSFCSTASVVEYACGHTFVSEG